MSNKILKVIKIIRYIMIIAFFGFSFYVATLPEYSNYDYFTRYFTSPFIWIIKETTSTTNFVFLGFFLATLVYFLIYGMVSLNTMRILSSTKNFLKGYVSLFKIKNVNDRYEAMIDFLFDPVTIQLMKSTISIFCVPLTIFAFKGITIDAFSYLSLNANYDFLWLNLLKVDPYFITSILLLILNVLIPLIKHFTDKKKEKTFEENVFYFFTLVISLLSVGTSFINVRFTLYILILSILGKLFILIKNRFVKPSVAKESEVSKVENTKEENIDKIETKDNTIELKSE